MTQALHDHGVSPGARVTVLTDGDPGLRAIQRAAIPDAIPCSTGFTSLGAGSISTSSRRAPADTASVPRRGRGCSIASSRAKWALWNGQLPKTRRHLSDLLDWTWIARADLSWLARVNRHLSELLSYLNANADSLPNYGARYRAGQAISTAFAESAVNAIVAKRMIKKQQMTWNRRTVQPFLAVRVAVLNETLEQAFRSWHAGFRPVAA